MEKDEVLVEAKWELAPGPFILTGHPPFCQGDVELINKSAEKLKLSGIEITGLDFKSGQKPAPAAVRTFVRLGPHARSKFPVQLLLDHTTPPGSYAGELCCGSQRERVVVHVLERWDLRIAPQSKIITAAPGERVTLRTLIANHGNMEFGLRSSDLIYFEDQQEIGRSLTAALKEAGKQGYQKFLDQFVQSLAETGVRPAAVRISFEGAVIPPGETKEVELEIRLPEAMKKNRVYRGRMRFKNAYLLLEVECNGAHEISPRRKQ